MSGRRVGDRFVVDAELGSGGMGSIYRGHDERLGGEVAIKFLKQALALEPLIRERFRREALSLAQLRHPGIVTVLDFGESEGELYTVLELVQGVTLGDLRQPGGMHVLRAAPIFDQVLAALDTCHEHEIIHRDIKPANVMITTVNGIDHVKLIDFGLARMAQKDMQTLTESGTVQGTPHYMAPEQCRGEEVSPASDIYSAGIMFYELLSGELPFHGHDAATFMAQHLFVDPISLRQVVPQLSAGIAAAVHSALAKDPAKRPSAKDLRSLLVSAFKGTDPEALAELAAGERKRVGGLVRSERQLTRPGGEAPVVAIPAAPLGGHVIVWMAKDDRSAELRGSLGTAGLSCSQWTKDELPETSGVGAVVVIVRDLARVAALRQRDAKLGVIAIDVESPAGATGAIRAGASDMLLVGSELSELSQKVKRLLVRKVHRSK